MLFLSNRLIEFHSGCTSLHSQQECVSAPLIHILTSTKFVMASFSVVILLIWILSFHLLVKFSKGLSILSISLINSFLWFFVVFLFVSSLLISDQVWSFLAINFGIFLFYILQQWFSTFLMPFNTIPHVVTSSHKIISLLLHNYNFATVINCNVNICHATSVGIVIHRLRMALSELRGLPVSC